MTAVAVPEVPTGRVSNLEGDALPPAMATSAAGLGRLARLALLAAIFAAVALFGLVASGKAFAVNDVFVYTGGTSHGTSAAAANAIDAMEASADFDVTTGGTLPAAGNGAGQIGSYKAIVFINGGSPLSGAEITRLSDYVNGGGGFMAIGPAISLHPSDGTFNTLLGISNSANRFTATSSAQRTIEAVDRAHPASKPLPLLSQRTGVFYEHGTHTVAGTGGGTFVAPAGSSHVVMRYRLNNQERTDDGFRSSSSTRPLAWCRDQQNGRTFYTGLGNENADWSNNNILGHIRGAIEYTAGLSRGDCRATIPSYYNSVRVMAGGDRAGVGLARTGEPHGMDVADNGWVIYNGRADCATNAERGAVAGTGSTGRILDFSNANVGIGCSPIHIFDPEEYVEGQQNSGITRAGTLAVYGDRGGGNAVNGKIETGGLSIVAAPNFSETGHIYVYYYATFNPNTMPPGPADGAQRRVTKKGEARISRFTIDLNTKQLDLSSEVVILKWNSQLYSCCHRGGGMDFDSDGNLYVVTGDNTSEGGNVSSYSASLANAAHLCPTNGSGSPGSASGENCGNNAADGFYRSDARRTSGNTNDLNGKMIRIKPNPAATPATPTGPGSTYTIPGPDAPNGPNLFSGSEGNGSQTRPEIYAMGFRNPGRVHVDPNTDIPHAAWVGPDGGSASNTGGMGGQEHWARIAEAGNYGWPYCAGGGANGRPMSYKSRNGESGTGYIVGADSTQTWFDCDNIRNDAPDNTGLVTFPHNTGTGKDAGRVKPATIWYGRPGSAPCMDYPRLSADSPAANFSQAPTQLCPYVTGGSAIMAGPVYGYKKNQVDNSKRWPEFWNSKATLFDWSNANAGKVAFDFEPGSIDQPPASATRMHPFVSWGAGAYMFGEFGEEGALYIQTYGETGYSFGRGPNDGLVRIAYTGGAPKPSPDPQLTSTAPNTGTFSIGTSGGVSYSWQFQGGGSASGPNPTHNFGSGGQKQVTLTVTYADGEEVSVTRNFSIPGEAGADDPPVTTHSFSPATPNGSNGWYTGALTATLNASDDFGVTSTQYCFGSGCTPDQNYSGPINVPEGGDIVLRYRSIDTASQMEATKTAPVVKRDATPPASTAAMIPASPNGAGGAWLEGSEVSISSSDATSGVAQIQYSTNGGGTWQTYNNNSKPTVTGLGSFTIQYRATDSAGNVETAKTLTVEVTDQLEDEEPPVSEAILNPYAADGFDDWYVTRPTVTITSDDEGSGVDTIQYRLGNSGPYLTYSAPIEVPDGDRTIQYRAIDVAGNIEQAKTLQVKVDSKSPKSTISFDPSSPGAGGTYESGPVSFELGGNDSHSGIDRLEYRIGGGEFVEYAGAVEVDGDGEHLIEYRAVDVAGNVEATNSTTITIDANGASLPPVTALIVTPLDPPVTASLTLTNPSVTAIEYRTRYSHNGTYWHPDSGWAPYSGPINFDKPGQWILYYRWRSAVTGQWSEEVAAPFTVAGTPPPPTKLGLSLSPKSKKLKKGKSVTVKAKVTNTGDIPATNVKVCVTASAKSAKVNGNKCVTQATLAPGESWTAKFKIKKTGTHKNVKPKFKVTSPDAASKGGNVQLRRK